MAARIRVVVAVIVAVEAGFFVPVLARQAQVEGEGWPGGGILSRVDEAPSRAAPTVDY